MSRTPSDQFDLFLQLEYLDDLLAAHPSDRLRSNIREVGARLERELRMLGVVDVEKFKREVRAEMSQSQYHARHEAHAEDRGLAGASH